MNELVVIKTFLYSHEAVIVRSILEREGIFCFLKDEFTIQANPFYSNALGGVKLQVRQEDEEISKKILEEYGYGTNEVVKQKVTVVSAVTGTINECPSCGDREISLVKKPSGVLFGLSVLLFGFPLPYFTTEYHCYNCGMDIKVKREKNAKQTDNL